LASKNIKHIFKGFRLDSRVKLITVFIFLVFIASVSKGDYRALCLYLIPCFAIIIFFRPPFYLFLKRFLIVSLFPLSVSVFLPFTNSGELLYSFNLFFFTLKITENGMTIFFTTIIKSILSVVVLAALVSSTGELEIIGGLRKIRFPSVLVSIIFLMYRYLFLIRDEARTGILAINSRVFHKSYSNINRQLAFLAGNLFIKSHDRAENIYKSMESRGFTGDFNNPADENKINPASLIVLSLFITTLAGFKCLELLRLV